MCLFSSFGGEAEHPYGGDAEGFAGRFQVVIPRVYSVCFYPFSHLSYFPIVVLHQLGIRAQLRSSFSHNQKKKKSTATILSSKHQQNPDLKPSRKPKKKKIFAVVLLYFSAHLTQPTKLYLSTTTIPPHHKQSIKTKTS